jgi:hypothetical protein
LLESLTYSDEKRVPAERLFASRNHKIEVRLEMGYLRGLEEYLDEKYHLSIFDTALGSGELWELHLHGERLLKARIVGNDKFDISVEDQSSERILIPKIQVKFLYREASSPDITSLLKVDPTIRDLKLEPILSPRKRYHVKNKSLYPLMHEKRVVFFTLLEGEVIRGIVEDFSRYDATVKLKGGIPLTLLRHAIYDLRDKKGRCFLKYAQEGHRDWEKSSLYTGSPSAGQ